MSRGSAGWSNSEPFGHMIPAEIEIEPGSGLPEFPVARRDHVFTQLFLLMVGLVSLVGLNPYALLYVGIDFTPSLIASSAGPVTLVLRTLGHGADIGDVKQGAVSTIEAVEESCLGQVLKELKDFLGLR